MLGKWLAKYFHERLKLGNSEIRQDMVFHLILGWLVKKHNMPIVKILVLQFDKLKKVYKISTNRIGIFRQTTIECLLSNEYKIIGLNN